ncbi:MAG: 2-amino-3,7-dideoxy-D-threo-hept-6-ulosonate synthase [Anaerolineae bacterium]
MTPDLLRMRRIFRPDGRAVIVALDYGLSGFTIPDLGDKVERVVAGGADAVLLTAGQARHHAHLLGRCGLILSVQDGRDDIDAVVLEAARMGADGIKAIFYTHRPDQVQQVAWVARYATACEAWGIPLLAEMIPVSFQERSAHTTENVAQAVQHAVEAGAHFLKVPYTGDPEGFRRITSQCPVPIVVLGGPRTEDVRAFLGFVKAAIDAGASGVAIGRNVWGHPHPERLTAALVALVHDGATVDEAAALLEG